jgi:hypothetical protein
VVSKFPEGDTDIAELSAVTVEYKGMAGLTVIPPQEENNQ